MFLAFLAFSTLFLAVQSKTFVSVDVRLICPRPFHFTLGLWEEDYITADDMVASFSGISEGNYDGTLSGVVRIDPPTNDFEFYIWVEHNCGQEGLVSKKYLPNKCYTSDKECTFVKQIIDLERESTLPGKV